MTANTLFRAGLSMLLVSILSGAPIFLTEAQAQLSYRSGQHVETGYEGWRENPDGTYTFVFGYFNENWEETLDIPIGENNFFSPGLQDRGQPTHFLPRRNRFTFEVVVPADWGDRELVWTVTSPNGETRRAYATLAADYTIDDIIIASETGSLGAGTSSPESRANRRPVIELLGDSRRTVKAGEALLLRAKVEDDGIPGPGRVGSRDEGVVASSEAWTRRILTPPSRVTVGKVNGLYLSWNKYRGPGKVSFDPPQTAVWEDTRTSANSPWGAHWQPPALPSDGIFETRVTFDQPGSYVLWGRADDGGLFRDQYVEITVVP